MRIPGPDNLGNAVPNPQQGTVNTQGLTAGVDSISQLAKIGASVAAQVANNQRTLDITSATTAASQELENYVFEMKNSDREYATQFERYQTQVKDISSRYQKQFEKDPSAFSVFKSNFGQLAFKRGMDVRSHSLNGQMDVQKGQLSLNMQSLAELAVQGDEEQRAMVQTKADLLLADAYQGGVIGAEEQAKMHMSFQDDVVSAQVRFDILQDPDSAATKLLKGEYNGLSNERSMIWLEKANQASEAKQRALYSAQDRDRREQERAEKRMQENMAKAGDKLLYAGELTTDWLESNRESLDQDDYRFYLKSLRTGDAGFTDAGLYADLRIRASNGDDVRDEARGALRRGRLKLQDYEKLVNRSEKNTGTGDVPNWFKRGEQYLGRVFQVSDINPDPAGAQRLASVMDEWSQWALDNPQAAPDQARKAYQELAKDYALIETQNMTLIKPLPRYVVGNRSALDVESTARATVEAFQNGEISEDEFNKQAALIKEWEDAMQKMRGSTDAQP